MNARVCFYFFLLDLQYGAQPLFSTRSSDHTGAIVVGISLHAGDHLACDFPRLINVPKDKYEEFVKVYLGTHKPRYIDLVKCPEGVTRILMVICMAVAFTLATTWFRKSQIKLPKPFDRLTGFNAFWYSHHIFYLKMTWMFLAVPVFLSAGERTLRFFLSGFSTVHLLKVVFHVIFMAKEGMLKKLYMEWTLIGALTASGDGSCFRDPK